MNNDIRSQFPFFRNNNNLVYLDNAATSQKPQQVIDAMSHYYEHENAPVHRGVYALAERSTELYEQARATVAQFIGAHADEIIFTKGTTEAINSIAEGYVAHTFEPGDEIILSELEHHANLVPWIRLEKTHKIVLNYIPIKADGSLDYEAYRALLSSKTRLVAVTHTSNVLGIQIDLPLIIDHAHAVGARVLVDAAQAVSHAPINVHALNVDFLAFSAHKMYGPLGIGALYIARSLQAQVDPYQVGGGMVYEVGFHDVSWAKPPLTFEAGTPMVAQAIGFMQAVNFIEQLPLKELREHEAALCAQLLDALEKLPRVRILGSPSELRQSGHLVSFIVDGMHPHDVAAYLDAQNICVRAGNQCAQPLHMRLGIDGSIRVSFAFYNTHAEVDRLIGALQRAL